MTNRIDSTVFLERTPPAPRLRNLGSMLRVTKQRTYRVMTRIGGGWSVRKGDAERSIGTFDSKKEAIEHAREIARASGGELAIHRRDGILQKLTTYPMRGASGRAKRR